MNNDTICALATRPGGAIGIIRVSGKNAISITDRLFRGKKALSSCTAGTLHYGQIVDLSGNEIDDVVVSLWRAPKSYTGEDSTEISCHGSAYILKQVMEALIEAGCRSAEPGEYTRRAFLNGKMDLSQAEAVADLVSATNRATHHMALSQLKGHFSSQLSKLREQLLKMTSLLELELDFSDHEELEFADRTTLRQLAQTIDERITRLAESFKTGNALKKGLPVAIIGKTNVGKSTLLNQLLGDDKAIVSDIHGTTRDVIEDTTEIDGITFRFIDTAGLRKTTDVVEQMGIDRSLQKLKEATIILWVNDQTPTPEEQESLLSKAKGKKVIYIHNKVDTPTPKAEKANPAFCSSLTISAKHGYGLDALKKALVKAADLPAITENDVIVTSTRHYDALMKAHDSLAQVFAAMDMNLSGDLIAEDLKATLEALGEITGGQISSQETLNNIFHHFCIGK